MRALWIYENWEQHDLDKLPWVIRATNSIVNWDKFWIISWWDKIEDWSIIVYSNSTLNYVDEPRPIITWYSTWWYVASSIIEAVTWIAVPTYDDYWSPCIAPNWTWVWIVRRNQGMNTLYLLRNTSSTDIPNICTIDVSLNNSLAEWTIEDWYFRQWSYVIIKNNTWSYLDIFAMDSKNYELIFWIEDWYRATWIIQWTQILVLDKDLPQL